MRNKFLSKALIVVHSIVLLASSSLAYGGKLLLNRELDLGAWSPFVTYWEAYTPVCVSSDHVDTPYRIIATDAQYYSTFSFSNEVGSTVPYSVYWQSHGSSSNEEELYPGIPSKRTYKYTPTNRCRTQSSTQMRVQVNQQDFNDAMPGVYQAVLSLTLSPL